MRPRQSLILIFVFIYEANRPDVKRLAGRTHRNTVVQIARDASRKGLAQTSGRSRKNRS
jgi:hypothetical protein